MMGTLVVKRLTNGFPTFSRKTETCCYTVISSWSIVDLLLPDKFVVSLANDKSNENINVSL